MDSIKKFKISISNWKFVTIVVIVIGVRGIRDNNGENPLLIVDGKGDFD
jgi:hypothetical protein